MDLSDHFESTEMDELASGFEFTEGPVRHPDGYLLFSDVPPSTIYHLEPGKAVEPWRTPTGHANGLALNRQGHVIACEAGARRITRIGADGTMALLASHYEGKRLNSPNDVVVRSDNSIYFTDPTYGRPSREPAELASNGVYRISAEGELELLLDDLHFPNGLAFSPDETNLYIANSRRKEILAYDVNPDGSLSNGRLFALMESEMEGGPDGMKVDVKGNIYCAGPGGLWVYEPDGNFVGVVSGRQRPANLAFGGADRMSLFLTARSSIYALRTKIAGLPLVGGEPSWSGKPPRRTV